jgi:hypothetical protein
MVDGINGVGYNGDNTKRNEGDSTNVSPQKFGPVFNPNPTSNQMSNGMNTFPSYDFTQVKSGIDPVTGIHTIKNEDGSITTYRSTQSISEVINYKTDGRTVQTTNIHTGVVTMEIYDKAGKLTEKKIEKPEQK